MPEERVQVKVGADAVGGPGAAQLGGNEVVQGQAHANLQGAGTARAPYASRRARLAKRGSVGKASRSVVTAVAAQAVLAQQREGLGGGQLKDLVARSGAAVSTVGRRDPAVGGGQRAAEAGGLRQSLACAARARRAR